VLVLVLNQRDPRQAVEGDPPATDGPSRDVSIAPGDTNLDLFGLATEDDIPGLSVLLEIDGMDRATLADSVGRDPRMFDRGCSPDRLVLLEDVTHEHEAITDQVVGDDLVTRREVAGIKYLLALTTAEIEHGMSAGAWGHQAAEELEELHQADGTHLATRLRLARVHRLLGEIETNQQHHDVAFAHQLFASDLIREAVEDSPGNPNLQLEWGLHLTYLGEAQLRFDKPQLALQSFQGGRDCFEKCEDLLGTAPDEAGDPAAHALWRTHDASRRYFEAYNDYEMAKLLTRANRSLDAREHWNRSLDEFELLAEEYPNSLKHLQRYAQAVSNEGSRLASSDQASGALPLFVMATELYSELVVDDPHGATNYHGLAMALGNQQMMLAQLEQFAEALEAGRQSLAAWENYVELRPNGNAAFREAVIWKTTELLAQLVVEVLPIDAAHALELAHEHQQLISKFEGTNQLIQETVTLFELELAMAEDCCDHAEGLVQSGNSDGALQWVQVIAPIVERLVQRQPDDERVLNVQMRIVGLQSP
jgi:tetratricopeptide (TPR) repeat protein